MKNKKLIAIDMDEVLCHTIDGILEYNNYLFNGRPIQKDDIICYNLWEIPGYDISLKQALDLFVKYLNSGHIPNFVEGAYEKLLQWKKLGCHFVVITGRGKDLEESSRIYIQKFYPEIFEEIYFCAYNTPEQVDKFTICKELGIHLIVEDHLQNAIKYTEHGIEVFLLDRPWNSAFDSKKYPHIQKFSTWDNFPKTLPV